MAVHVSLVICRWQGGSLLHLCTISIQFLCVSVLWYLNTCANGVYRWVRKSCTVELIGPSVHTTSSFKCPHRGLNYTNQCISELSLSLIVVCYLFIYRGRSDYMNQTVECLRNDHLEMTWKEVAMVCIKILFWDLPAGAEETHRRPQSG